MGFEIRRVITPADTDQFIRLPWNIYSDYPCWIPPLISERKRFLNPEVNPFFEHADVDLFLVWSEGGTSVGRIACIHDRSFIEHCSEKAGCFGLFESIDEQKVADLLLDRAFNWSREKGLAKILGPMNMSTNHECGLLIEGYESPPMLGIPYNPPYYKKLFERWGLHKAKELLSLKLDLVQIPGYLEQSALKLRKRDRFSIRPLRLDRFEEEMRILWDIYVSAWDRNWGFVPMNRKEFFFLAKEVKSIIQPEFCLIAHVGNEPAGFAWSLPNANQVLKVLNGRLFPFGWARFLWNRNKINTYRVLTVGVKKKYRRLGIDAYFYYELYKQFLLRKISWCDMSWVLEDNQDILAPMHRIGGTTYKRHRIYERACTS